MSNKSVATSRHSSACYEKRSRNKSADLSNNNNHKENIVPLSGVHSNILIAKTLAKENQLHQPLPDNFDQDLYKISTRKVDDKECNTVAVGCKGYGVPGPTQCSKLKVYRPRTAHEFQRESAKSSENEKHFNVNSKLHKKDFYSEIDYALCWDLCPPGHEDQAQKSPHIDGSNGSLAPAVFSLVQSRDPSPCIYESKRDGLHSAGSEHRASSAKSCFQTEKYKDRIAKAKEWVEVSNPKNTVNPSAVMTIVKKTDEQESFPLKQEAPYRPITNKTRCSSCSSQVSKIQRESSPKPKTIEHNSVNQGIDKYVEKEEIENRLKQRNCQSSTQNIVSHGSNGVQNNHTTKRNNTHSGQVVNNQIKNDKSSKDFVCPRLQRSRDSSVSSSSRKNRFSPPKLKDHSNKKNYAIDTLAPPFTLWPGTTGQDYPEHWRLASVYQHSYKPIEMRKRNLLQCIYQ